MSHKPPSKFTVLASMFTVLAVTAFNPLIILCNFLTLLLRPSNSMSVDPYYGVCNISRHCGSQQINYPFHFITHEDETHKSIYLCGYPGYQVSCKDNQTILKLSGDEYVVRDISYPNQSLRLVNSAFLEEEDDTDDPVCRTRVHNLSLDDGRFKFPEDTHPLYLMSNCSVMGIPGNSTAVDCLDGRRVYVTHEEDGKFPCGNTIKVHYSGKYDDNEVAGINGLLRDGVIVTWTATNCSACLDSGGQCGYNETDSKFQCFCSDRPHSRRCHDDEPITFADKKRPWRRALILGLAVGGGAFIFVALLFMGFWCCRKHNLSGVTKLGVRNISYCSRRSELEDFGSSYFGVAVFTYNELEQATTSFDSSRELGDGGFGTVYHGKLKDGREVAVKRLYEKNYKRVEQFMNEVEILTRLRHPNLVSLYGCTSRHSRELLLVYEYVCNGTVANHLHGDGARSGALPWSARMRIAVETAGALSYLHHSDVIHRDVKTNNILLDDNFSVKVADFGLSRFFPTDMTHISTTPQGTPGYLDPEYHQCYHLTDKSDVYSFGVVLVELISSLPAVDVSRHRHEINLSNYAMNKIQCCAFDELVDPRLGFESDFKVRRMTTLVAELSFQCLQNENEFRPSMDEVLEALQRIESADYRALEVEEMNRNHTRSESIKQGKSPVENDGVGLLDNVQKPTSPISVMQKWGSSTTTPNTSG